MIKTVKNVLVALIIGYWLAQGCNTFILWEFVPVREWHDIARIALLIWLAICTLIGVTWEQSR